MLTLPLRKILSVATVLVAASLAVVSLESAVAQQGPSNQGSGQGVFKPPHRGPAIGGTSWTLRDVWGEPKMPPAPKDFGPGYDFTPNYDLNGGPNQSPYPN